MALLFSRCRSSSGVAVAICCLALLASAMPWVDSAASAETRGASAFVGARTDLGRGALQPPWDPEPLCICSGGEPTCLSGLLAVDLTNGCTWDEAVEHAPRLSAVEVVLYVQSVTGAMTEIGREMTDADGCFAFGLPNTGGTYQVVAPPTVVVAGTEYVLECDTDGDTLGTIDVTVPPGEPTSGDHRIGYEPVGESSKGLPLWLLVVGVAVVVVAVIVWYGVRSGRFGGGSMPSGTDAAE